MPTRADYSGIALAVGIGAVAVVLVKALPPSPLLSDVLLALLFGAIVSNSPLGTRVLGLGAIGSRADRFAAGVRYTGKWILRLSIILMGLKVQTSFFGRMEIATIFVVAAASVPSAFFVAHVLGVLLRVRRPLVDLLAGGTMICGASAVNAIAPACRAHKEEQGIAIAVVFLFSVTAMLSFRTIAFALGLDPTFAGLWSGLAVNDLASAIAVGAQMGESGGVMSAASKSARILLLAPVLVAIALARRGTHLEQDRKLGGGKLRKSIVDALPEFILGYVALAVVRAAGDRLWPAAPFWRGLVAGDKLVVDVLMSAVAAGIGLQLSLRTVLGSSARAIGVGAGTSVWMAGLTVAMITLLSRGHMPAAIVVGGVGLAASFALFRGVASSASRARRIRERFEAGLPLTLDETTVLLEARELEGAGLDDGFLRRILGQLRPSYGELAPARSSPLDHGEGCRWLTYWEGRTGWALVAIVREPGSATPIHAHPHRLLGRAVAGKLEELVFREVDPGTIELVGRQLIEQANLVEADGLAKLHVVRAVGEDVAIDLQLRGPELGEPGRVLRPCERLDLSSLSVGARIATTAEVDRRPGQSGDGSAAGRLATTA